MPALLVYNEVNYDPDVTGVNDTRNKTDSLGADANYSRYHHQTDNTSQDGYWYTYSNPIADNLKSIWIHIRYYSSANFSDSFFIQDSLGENMLHIELGGGSTTARFEMGTEGDGNPATAKLIQYDTTLFATQTFDCEFDVQNGILRLYKDGTLVATNETGTPLLMGTAGIAINQLRHNGGGGASSWGELIVQYNEPTLGYRVKNLAPNAAGTYTDWTGAYTDIDELGLDTLDYNLIGGTGTQTYGYTDIAGGLQTGMQVKGVCIACTADADIASTVTNQYYNGSTLYDLGSGVNAQTDLFASPITSYHTVNPGTSAAWTFAEINAAEFGFKAS